MVVTLGFYPGDRDQAVRLADWMNELGEYPNHELFILRDKRCEKIPQLGLTFGKITELIAHAEIDGWPEGANYFFRTVTSHLSYRPELKYFFWMEPDTIPLVPEWLDKIEQEYLNCGKKFLGDRVEVENIPLHLSGVGVYPNPLHAFAGEAYRAADEAFDMAGRQQIVPQAHFTKLIEHAWRHETFTNTHELQTQIRPEAVLFHSSKDGSLIDILRLQKRQNLSEVQNGTINRPISVTVTEGKQTVMEGVPEVSKYAAVELSTQNREMAKEPEVRTENLREINSGTGSQERKDSATREMREVRGDEARSSSPRLQQGSGSEMAVSPVSSVGTCDIFIRTYPKDYQWLSYCLESIRKYTTGFRKIWIVSPEKPVFLPPDVEWKVLNEETEDGYLAQQIHKLYADVITDYEADYILFTDSDTLFTQPVTPETFFKNGKIVWYYTPYDHTDVPWKPITEKFLGKEVKYEFMRRHPFVVPKWLFPRFREYCHQTHGVILSEYIRMQPNRSFSEFNALGAFAYEKYRDKFEWVNTVEQEPPPPVVRQFFSWSGITPEVDAEIKQILSGGVGVGRTTGIPLTQTFGGGTVSVTIPSPSAIEVTPVPPQNGAGDHIRWLRDYVKEKPSRRQYVMLQLAKAGLQPKWKKRK